MNKTIFKAVVGSRSYGTFIEGVSDTDYKSVFVQDIDKILGFGYKPQVDSGKDDVSYEVRRFLELLQTANPTVLELLYSPEDCILEKTPEFDLILEHKERFLTKKCLNSFGGYAVAQIKKARGLDKKMNWDKSKTERKDVLDFCYVLDPEDPFSTIGLKQYLKSEGKLPEHCGLTKLEHFRDTYTLFYDHLAEMQSTNPKFEGKGHNYQGICKEGANDVHVSEVPKYAVKETTMVFNKDAYSVHCKEYNQYQGWLQNRNTQRYVDTKEHDQQIDGKNLLHCRRLLDMAIEIATEGKISVRRPNADYLLKIRRGEVKLEEIIEQAEKDVKDLDRIYAESNLPEEVDLDFVNDLLLKIRKYDINKR